MPEGKLTGIGHIELRVRKLRDSARFYCELLGLTRMPAAPPSDRVCVCTGAPTSGCEGFSIVLTEGLPESTELAGLDHVGLNVPTEQDVRDTYARARHLGFRATQPRMLNGGFQTFVFDPNGYKIEVAVRPGTSRNVVETGRNHSARPADAGGPP